jgi:hypothetical protein
MATQLSKGDIVRLLGVNQLLYTRTAPTNPVTERTQKKSYAENGSNASLSQSDHLIVNLQTGTEFIDPLQSFLVFDIVVSSDVAPVASANTLYFPGSACNLIRDTQVSTRSGKEMDRLEQANLLDYHMVWHDAKEHASRNLQGLMMAEVVPNKPAALFTEQTVTRNAFIFPVGITDSQTQRVMIPLKYISPIFDSQKLMPPHLARGLRIDCTLEAFATAFASAQGALLTGPDQAYTYQVQKPYILTDSYRMSDSVLEYLNANFASEKSGLVYEYFSWHNTKTQSSDTSLNVEVRSSVSMATDAFMVTRDSTADTVLNDSFRSEVLAEGDRSQWRIGSHYLPNAPINGRVEHYAQMLYWQDKLRHMIQDGCNFSEFVGRDPVSTQNVGSGTGKFPVVLSRNNVLDLSGVSINNSMTLAAEVTLAAGGSRDISVFLRSLRRAILFIESVVLET